jgi:hypothetical protein
MGSYLRSWYGSDYCAVGTAYGKARFDPPIYGVATEPADDHGSFDRELAAAFSEPTVVDLHRWPADRPRRSLRSAGEEVVYDLPQAFDLLGYVPGLSNARELTA